MADELSKTEYDDDIYMLSEEEGKRNKRGILNALLYLVLAAVVLITGAHGIMLVLSQTAGFELSGVASDNGVITAMLTAFRVSFPVIMELAAVVAGIGFIQSRWRGSQRTYGIGIELAWAIFAAANMMSVFTLEMGGSLQAWQEGWVQYGLPLSALVAGGLTYMLLREDPDHKRQQERAATSEKIAGIRFRNFQKVMLSPEMMKIEQQMAYLQAVQRLKEMGYTPDQIRFLTQHIPELNRDADGNGTPDILEITGNAPARPQIAPPAPTNGVGVQARQLGFDAPGNAHNATQGQQRSDLPPAGNGRAPGNARPKASSRPVVQSQPAGSIEGHTQSGRPVRSQPEPVNKERLWSNGSNTIYRESYCPSCRQHVAAGHVRNLSCPHCGVWIREATELEVLREGHGSRNGVVLDQRLYRTGAWLPEKPTATHTNDGAPLSLDGLDLEEPGK